MPKKRPKPAALPADGPDVIVDFIVRQELEANERMQAELARTFRAFQAALEPFVKPEAKALWERAWKAQQGIFLDAVGDELLALRTGHYGSLWVQSELRNDAAQASAQREQKIITIEEAADLLGVSRSWLYEHELTGENFYPERTGGLYTFMHGGKRVTTPEEVEAYRQRKRGGNGTA